jgi:uncharacterized membrane protein
LPAVRRLNLISKFNLELKYLMRSKVKLFGHPIHPMLIVFPLGLLAVAAIFDGVYLVTANKFWGTMSYYLIAAGLIGGLAAAIFGFLDWMAIPHNTRAQTIGLIHGGSNMLVLLLFLVSWVLRRNAGTEPTTIALAISFVGVGVALFGAWLGGELVTRLGVSVDDGAHLNAPNSLSGRPAREEDTDYATQSNHPRQAH